MWYITTSSTIPVRYKLPSEPELSFNLLIFGVSIAVLIKGRWGGPPSPGASSKIFGLLPSEPVCGIFWSVPLAIRIQSCDLESPPAAQSCNRGKRE